MDAKLLTAPCEGQLDFDKLKAALLASEAINHALIRILDGYVSQAGFESREKMLVPIRRKLRLTADHPLNDDATFEAAFKLAVASTEQAIGL